MIEEDFFMIEHVCLYCSFVWKFWPRNLICIFLFFFLLAKHTIVYALLNKISISFYCYSMLAGKWKITSNVINKINQFNENNFSCFYLFTITTSLCQLMKSHYDAQHNPYYVVIDMQRDEINFCVDYH